MKSVKYFYFVFIIFGFPSLFWAEWKEGLSKPGFYAVISGKATYFDFKTLSDAESIAKELSPSFFANAPLLKRGDFIALYGDMPRSSRASTSSNNARGRRYTLNNIQTKYIVAEDGVDDEYFSIVNIGKYNEKNIYRLTPRKEILSSDYYCIYKCHPVGNFEYSEDLLSFKYQLDDAAALREPDNILDAYNIEFTADKMLVADADFPRWSPDGQKILYDLITPRGIEIWHINADGSQKVSVANGTHACWSPDGNKIAYLTRAGNTYALNIYDLKQKKVLYVDDQYRDIELNIDGRGIIDSEYDVASLYWLQNKIVYVGSLSSGYAAPEARRVKYIDLDTLKWESSSETRERGIMNEINFNRGVANYNIQTVPPYKIKNKYISDISRYGTPAMAKGMWITAKDEKYFYRILEDATQPQLSRDLNKIVYVKIRKIDENHFTTDIHIASIFIKSDEYKKYYEIEIGRNNGVNEGDYMLIASPKINPLNEKVIGYQGPVKAIVFVKGVKADTSIVCPEVVLEIFGIGDLATYESRKAYGVIKAIHANSGGYSTVENPPFISPEEVPASRQIVPSSAYSESDLISSLKKAQYVINGGKDYAAARILGAPNGKDLSAMLKYVKDASRELKMAEEIARSLSNSKAGDVVAYCQGCIDRDAESFRNRGRGNNGFRDASRSLREYLKGK